MKRLIATMAALLISLMAVSAASAQESQATPGIRVLMDGQELAFDEAPFVEEGRTLVPLRALAENLGFAVAYDAADQKITLTKDGSTLVLWVDHTKVVVNGEESVIDVSPKVRNGRSFVPVRFVAERLGASVGWNAEQQSVTVSRGVDARQLLDKLSAAQNTWPPADQKMTAEILVTTQMGVAGQSLSFEMPMTVDLHIHKGDLLSTYTIVMPAMLNRPPMTMQMAMRGGKVYVSNPETGEWTVMEETSPTSLTDLTANPQLKNFVNPVGVQAEMLKGAQVTYGPTEVMDGNPATRLDITLSPEAVTGLFDTMLAGLTGVGGDQPGVKMAIERFKMSHWVDLKSSLARKTTVDMVMNMTITQGGQTQSIKMTMDGTMKYQYVSEPILFPDLP